MDIAGRAAALRQRLLAAIYPPRCVLCDAPGFDDLDICAGCYRRLPWIETACTRCAIPLVAGNDSNRHLSCGRCLNAPPAFDHSISLFRYQGDAIRLVHQLKFNEKLVNARLLGTLLAAALQQRPGGFPDCIVPVPLHPKRLRRRGFNQSIELARTVGKVRGVPVNVQAVRRVRDTRSQTGLDRKQRRTNMRGAFEIVRAPAAAHVAILDDVVTTTSTVNELAGLLKTAGIRRVDVWSIARAV